MGKALFAGTLAAMVTIWLIASATHGAISKFGDLSKVGRLGVTAGLCAIAALVYFYLEGGVDHLLWLYSVPTRPEQEVAFVARAEESLRQMGSSADCVKHSVELTHSVGPVTDWIGTVRTKYLVGTGLAFVVKVGRYTDLRTSYLDAKGASLVHSDSPIFKEAENLVSGDPIRFSGSMAQDAATCVLRQDDDDTTMAEFAFRFTSVVKIQ